MVTSAGDVGTWNRSFDGKTHTEDNPVLLANAVRFDHYPRHRVPQADDRASGSILLRQIADAIRYAHRKRVIHRALGPQSILVTDADSKTPRLQVYNWQVGVRETRRPRPESPTSKIGSRPKSLVYMSPEAIADPAR